VEQLVQAGIGDARLELRAGRTQQPDPRVGGERGGTIKQAGLPDARVTRQQQGFPPSAGKPAMSELTDSLLSGANAVM
jgi:hypothetical protein